MFNYRELKSTSSTNINNLHPYSANSKRFNVLCCAEHPTAQSQCSPWIQTDALSLTAKVSNEPDNLTTFISLHIFKSIKANVTTTTTTTIIIIIVCP